MKMKFTLVLLLSGVAAGGTMGQVGAQAGLDLDWIRVQAGTFLMGCVDSDAACLETERPQHEVTFLEPFEIMASEVTVAEYAEFVRSGGHGTPPTPDFPQTSEHPVVLVSWGDAATFCAWAGARLPTEAEWEYAARGGRSGLIYAWGNDPSRDYANYGAEQCCSGATGGADIWRNTAPVRSFPPNEFGLYDMAGNVWEWVDGWLDDDDYRRSPAVDPPGASSGYARIARGGSWLNFPGVLRTSVRLPFSETGQTSNVGVRCARDVTVAVAD